jgi:hypothetical protein
LPFAPGFFDAIVAIDSFPYFGSDDLYLNYLGQFVIPSPFDFRLFPRQFGPPASMPLAD